MSEHEGNAQVVRCPFGACGGTSAPPCPFGDCTCPCRDGDLCHYLGADAWEPPEQRCPNQGPPR